MRRTGAIVGTALGIMAFGLATAPIARGHGGLSLQDDECLLRAGDWVIHFTGYQPERTGVRTFCEDIPATGRTIVVLDYHQDQLRDLPVEVRIVRDVGSEADLEAITVLHHPPEVHPRGTLRVEHTFPEPGRFVGLVTIHGDDPQVSRFPFAVGGTGWWGWASTAAAGVFVLALGVGLFLYSSRAG